MGREATLIFNAPEGARLGEGGPVVDSAAEDCGENWVFEMHPHNTISMQSETDESANHG
jgi:hypothetical protein